MSVEHTLELEKLRRDTVSRRAFLKRMGAAGLGLAAVNLLNGCGGGGDDDNNSSQSRVFRGIPGSGDTQVLNFALTLEILEADLYRQALNKASNKPLDTPLAPAAESVSFYGTQPAIPTGSFSEPGVGAQARAEVGFLYLRQFAYVEAAHRDFLRVALGGAAVGPAPRGYRFNAQNNPGDDVEAILRNIIPLEETGVRAYLGAVEYVENGERLQIAGTIYSTECRHSAAVRYLVNENNVGPTRSSGDLEVANAANPNTQGVATTLFEKYLAPNTVLQAASAYIVP